MDHVELGKTFLRRVVRSNFQVERATDEERRELTDAKVTDPLAQDYAAWRRAALVLCAITMTVWGILEVATVNEVASSLPPQVRTAARSDNLDMIDGLFWVIRISQIIAVALVIAAARNWKRIRRSRRWARGAFYVLFVTPFALAALPVSAMLDLGHLTKADAQAVTYAIGGLYGFRLFLIIGPRAIAMFPATLRSSMMLKTLVPESPLPGWITVMIAPLYPLFLIALFAFVNQVSGDVFVLAGLVCLIIAPFVYLRASKDIVAPQTPDQVEHMVVAVRRRALLFNLAGGACIAISAAQIEWFEAADVVKVGFAFVSNLLLLSVVGADMFLALLAAGHNQSKAFEGSDLARSLDAKFAGLARIGLTEIKVSDATIPPQPPPRT